MGTQTRSTPDGPARLAVIGLGDRASYVARLICESDGDTRLAGVVDAQPADVIRERIGRRKIPTADDSRIYPTIESLLADADRFSALVIGTPCHLHTPTAVAAAACGLPIYLEKPVAVSWHQAGELARAFAGRYDSVVVSFPLRLTIHVQKAREVIRSRRLGTINQLQAVNNVSYGGVYYGQWYREYEMTGGLWLQKATHDFDYINHLLDTRPCAITAMHGRLAYGGDKSGDLTCSRCDSRDTCPEGPPALLARGDDGGSLNHTRPTPEADHACNFSETIVNQDCGTAIVMYGNGVHASYVQNFIPRRSAGQRGATVIGYDATLHFSWHSGKLRVIDHHRENVEEIELRAVGGHGGGDGELAANFVEVMRGRARSRSPLGDGLLSAAMCLCARDAAATGATQAVPEIDPATGAIIFPDRPLERVRVRGSTQVEPPVDDRRAVGLAR